MATLILKSTISSLDLVFQLPFAHWFYFWYIWMINLAYCRKHDLIQKVRKLFKKKID